MLYLHPDMKRFFLDRPAVTRAMDAATHQAMRKALGTIRKTAQRSMRYTTEKPDGTHKASAPGQPPRAVKPHPWLRKNLWFAYDPRRQEGVAGPVALGAAATVPPVLEFGGRVRLRNRRRRVRRVGDSGEIRLGGMGRTAKLVKDSRGNTRVVTYGRLRTAAGAHRANRINRELYGPASRTVTIRPRPYMGPTLESVAPTIPALWRNALRRS